jgi:hypothetical protein
MSSENHKTEFRSSTKQSRLENGDSSLPLAARRSPLAEHGWAPGECRINDHSGRADRFLGVGKGVPIFMDNIVNFREQDSVRFQPLPARFDTRRLPDN